MLLTLTNLIPLSQLIERLLDADRLPDEEGRLLLGQIEAVRQSLVSGDENEACRHTERFHGILESLTRDGRLDREAGCAVARKSCGLPESSGRS